MTGKTLHAIAWKCICRPKNQGGLKIPILRNMNDAFLAKYPWKFAVADQGGLVITIRNQKYGGWDTLAKDDSK